MLVFSEFGEFCSAVVKNCDEVDDEETPVLAWN